MEILAGCKIEELNKYSGKLVVPNEEGKKPNSVSINLIVDEGDTEVYKNLSGTEKCITFKGKPPAFVPSDLKGKVFNEVTLEDFLRDEQEETYLSKDSITLIRVDNSYSCMWQVYDLCNQYPTIRFIGGNLLNIEGVRIGRFDLGKDKMSPVFCDMYDTFIEAKLEDLGNLQEIIKVNSKKLKTGSKNKIREPREKKEPKKKVSFRNLFGDAKVEF